MNNFKYTSEGIIEVKESLINTIERVLNIEYSINGYNNQDLDKIFEYIKDKKIRPFQNKNEHNYNYYSNIELDRGNLTNRKISNAYTTSINGLRLRGNNINYSDIYIFDNLTLESHIYDKKIIEDKIKKKKEDLERLELELKEYQELIEHMEINQIKELDKEEYIIYKKLINA